jgi:hypothetical protein
MQQTYRTKTRISKDGKLHIEGLPFQAGEIVEVTVRRGKKSTRAAKYPLRGKPVIYHEPFKPVDPDESNKSPRVPGIDKGKIVIMPDFDAPLKEFEE